MHYRDSRVGAFKGTAPEILPDGSAIYTCDDGGRFYLHIFQGKALRLLSGVSGWYRTDRARADAIEHFRQSRARFHANTLLRRQASKRPHTLKTGDILNTCWGYEQTNVEFYQIIAVKGVMVTLRQIACDYVPTEYMSGETTPRPDKFIGEPIRRRADSSNHVKINHYIHASPWDGHSKHVSSYC